MKTKNKIIKLFAFAIVFTLLTGALAMNVSADDSKKGSIRIKYLENKVSDVHFKLYKVANFDGAKFVGTGDFANYSESISFNPQNQSEWNSLAYTLKSYIIRDDVNLLDDDYTNRNYQLTFTGLDKGLYLVIGDKVKEDNITYKSAPFFVVIPYKDGEYDVTVKPKYQTKIDEYDTVKRKALKVWQNDSKRKRPRYIEVELLRDGKVYDTVKLTENNNWRYTWDELSDEYDWLVVEKDVPDNYNVRFDRRGITFVITNTYDNPPPPKEKEKKKKKKEKEEEINEDETPRATPEEEIKEDIPEEEIIEEEIPLSSLPQTGVLWWPIPILFVSGLIMLAIGFKKRVK